MKLQLDDSMMDRYIDLPKPVENHVLLSVGCIICDKELVVCSEYPIQVIQFCPKREPSSNIEKTIQTYSRWNNG